MLKHSTLMETAPEAPAIETRMVGNECPACGPAPTSIWLDNGNPSRYLRCRGCDTVFLSPHPARNAGPAEYDDVALHVKVAATRRPALEFIAGTLDARKKRGRMLDIGCSNGDLFAFFDPRRWERHGVEPFAAAAEIAARTYGVQIHPGTLRTAAYNEASFDLVTIIDALYLVPDPQSEFREIARVLRPGGLLAIEFAGGDYSRLRNRGLLCRYLDGGWTRLRTDGNHFYWYSVAGLERLLRRCGFTVLERIAVPSPLREGPTRHLAEAYNFAMAKLTPVGTGLLSWAPKYLCIARKI